MTETADYVFLHGMGQGGWVWSDTIAALEAQTRGRFGRALALDAPGCGTKRGRVETWGAEEIAAELVGEIEAAGFRDVVIAGHSQAGTVLPHMARMRPDLFRRLVYVTAVAPLDGENVTEMGRSLASDAPSAPPREPPKDMAAQLRAVFCNDMSPDGADAFMGRLGSDAWPAQTMTESRWSYDHLGAVPATYIVCLSDLALVPAWQEAFAGRLKVDRRVRIDAGHQVMITRPHALAEALRFEAAQ